MPRSTPRNKRSAKHRRNKTKTKTSGRTSTTKRNPFAALVVTGVRSLIASLPGASFLSPIVDLVFSSIGMASAASLTSATDVTIYGLCAVTALSYANILARVSSTARNISKGPRIEFDSPYTDAKLERLNLSVLPDTKIQTRSGRWACAFIPFRNVNDAKETFDQYKPMTLSAVQSLAGSVTCAADKALHLVFRPRAEDGYVFQFNSIESYFGCIVIAYSEEVRSSYHEFTADDFSPNITVRGTLKLRQPRMDGSVNGYKDQPHVYNVSPRASIFSSSNNTWYHFAANDSFKCEKKDKQCTITGTSWEATYVPPKRTDKVTLDLRDLEIN